MARQFITNESYYTNSLPSGIASNETTLTMACFFKTTDVTSTQFLMSVCDTASNDNNQSIFADGGIGGDPVSAFTNGGTPLRASTTTGFTANTFYHACAVWNGASSRSAFINGGSKGTETTSQTPTGLDRLSIGSVQDLAVNYSPNVTLAEVAVWDVALTDAEVAILPNYSPLFVRPQNLVFYRPFIRATSGVVESLSLFTDGTPNVSNHPRIIRPSPKMISYAAAPPPPAGRIMSSLVNHGGLAGMGGLAGQGGGLAG